MNWQPGAKHASLVARAALLNRIRAFFQARDILEVETPLLCSAGITDPSIEPLIVPAGDDAASRFLQTSPEYAMKRLLAADSRPIFQIAKAFREGEAGSRHNPEFSLLEWYRPGYDHQQLMDEVAELVGACLGDAPVQRLTYREAFLQFLSIDPFTIGTHELERVARAQLDISFDNGDRDLWLDLLMSHLVEPRLADKGRVFLYDYPASQAALARISFVDGVEVGHRFELYVDGMELANGYFELSDPIEQRSRFESDNRRRRESGQLERPLDEQLLAALEAGMPSSSGVALGVDRLLMLATGATDIRDVLAFSWERS